MRGANPGCDAPDPNFSQSGAPRWLTCARYDDTKLYLPVVRLSVKPASETRNNHRSCESIARCITLQCVRRALRCQRVQHISLFLPVKSGQRGVRALPAVKSLHPLHTVHCERRKNSAAERHFGMKNINFITTCAAYHTSGAESLSLLRRAVNFNTASSTLRANLPL